jgi:sialate O-acetylesterase
MCNIESVCPHGRNKKWVPSWFGLEILFAWRILFSSLQDQAIFLLTIFKIPIMKNTLLCVISLFSLFILIDANAEVRLPVIFQSNMVLQRDMPVRVWGWADPKEKIIVSLNGQSVSIVTSKNGKWQGELPALNAGGPYNLVIQGKNKIVLTDVLIGDVWICSGQSNMQWPVNQTGYTERDTSFIQRAPIRLFTVQIDMDYMPREDIKGGEWKKLNKDNIGTFSAVAYHFGKYLSHELNVPIGLISDNLGATAVETWMSNDALLQFPQFKPLIEPVIKEGKNFEQLQTAFGKIKPQWNKHYYTGIGIDQGWYKPVVDDGDWKSIKASGNTWEEVKDLRNYDGAVWFRTTFDMPENYNQKSFTISLSQIDDYDVAWVNGQKIGETYGRHNHRNYTVPVELLKDKGNVLAVRVFDVGGIGGFTTNSFWGNTILWGDWVYKKDEGIDIRKIRQPNLANATPFSSPGVLYNANIAPLISFAIKGIIWYQGESNADRAYEYRALFPALIRDWRKQWRQDFPFLFVQLANYEAESTEPKESNWAELREAQAMALSLPNTGMATAIDIGEANDIHPKNKEAVGARLGLAALKVAYGKDTIISGPTFKNMKVEGNRAIIAYENLGAGLLAKDKYGYVRGFQMAGDDQKFYWAQAKIQGATIVVTCSQVKNPVAVRYAWDNNPGSLDLYNKAGLPAIPFRTDQWKGITADAVFKEGPRF